MKTSFTLLLLAILLAACSSTSEVAEEVEVEVPDTETVHSEATSMPVMIGGQERFYRTLRYPDASRSSNHQGRALLSYTVTPDGLPADIEVLSSSGHPLLDQAGIRALRQMRFEPGIIDGEAIYVRMTQPVMFMLE